MLALLVIIVKKQMSMPKVASYLVDVNGKMWAFANVLIGNWLLKNGLSGILGHIKFDYWKVIINRHPIAPQICFHKK